MARRKTDPTLPVHCSWLTDRHGKRRLRHQLGGKCRYFKHSIGSAEWLVEYREYENSCSLTSNGHGPNTLGDLISRYYLSSDFLQQSKASQASTRSALQRFCLGRDEWPVERVDFEMLDQIIARTKTRRRCEDNNRMIGGPAAAKELRKTLMRLFRHAVRCRMIATNPVADTNPVRYQTVAHHTWTEGEIAAFQQRHPLGSKARLALEIMLWSGQRRGDVQRFGPQHVTGGRIRYTQGKSGKMLWLPMAAPLQAAIDAAPASEEETFLVSRTGKPFSRKGLGQWFRDRCDEAGLQHCSAHGLRKAIARRLAEAGASQPQIKAVGGWSRDGQVAIYTADADQARLAADAFARLAQAHDNAGSMA